MVSLLSAGQGSTEKAWKNKPVTEWTADDAQQVMTDSPWAKTTIPVMEKAANEGPHRGGGGYPRGGARNDTGGERTDQGQPPTLTLRWESAVPIREAELKAGDVDAPTVDEEHYAIAVLGVPRNMLNAETRTMEGEFKKQATLKRDGKKDLKPSSVEIHQCEDGLIILYSFPRSNEISKYDRRVEFDAQIGRLKFTEPFYIEEMVYAGNLEL
jgi:hypothetical protein